VGTKSENDRVRYTGTRDARKEVLRRLLVLNHVRAEGERAKGAMAAAKKKQQRATAGNEELQPQML